MDSTDLQTNMSQREYAPVWAVILAATMLAASFGRRRIEKRANRPDEETPRGSDSTQLDDGRGRKADAPSEIPTKGWKDILLRVYRGISEDRILLIAAGVTFYLLLSIFPGLAALFSIYGLFANPAEIAGHLDTLANIEPGGAMDVLRDEMIRLASKGGTALGVGFIVGLVVSLWTAKSGISAIFDALNIVYEEKETRNLQILLGGPGLHFDCDCRALTGGVELHPTARQDGSAHKDRSLADIVRAGCFRIGSALPVRTEPYSRALALGHVASGLATVLWIAASVLFSWYVATFGSYDKTYGSLGAIIGFMTWIWISIIVVLLGAKLDAEMEHQTARDTTKGPPKRLGMRGARMADTIAAAQE